MQAGAIELFLHVVGKASPTFDPLLALRLVKILCLAISDRLSLNMEEK
jgi:hypothetical protein